MANELERLRAERDRLTAALAAAEDRLHAAQTDRESAIRDLRESEQRFRALVASVPGAVYLSKVDPPWRDTFVSDGVQTLTGYPAEEFLRPDGITFADLTLPEDLQRVSQKLAAGVAARTVVSDRYRIRKKDGSVRWVMDETRAAYEPSGQPKFLAGVILDITDLMLAEEALKASQGRLVEAQQIARMGSWELDLATGALTWSAEIYRIFELDPKDFKATYSAFLDAIHPADRDRVDLDYTQAVAQHTPYDLVHRLLMRDGRVKFVHERAVTDYDAADRPVRSAGTVQDITELHHAEEARQNLANQLRESQKMEAMGTLAGGIAHDFNNLLAAIVGHAELLEHDLPPEGAQRKEVAGVLAACRRARDLVQQILTFSHRGERERVPTAFGPIVREALSLLRSTLPSTIEIRAEIPPRLPAVLADPTQLHQVIVNLGTNGAHAMRERGGILRVSLGTVELDDTFARSKGKPHGGPYVRLTVRDGGSGMNQETLGRIFEPFFTTKARGEGTGLGLAVVHGIVESHDGLVSVDSEPGRGTTFSIDLPAVAGSEGEGQLDEEPIPRGHGEHLLVLDDEPVLVDVARRHLTRLGYRVTGLTHPADALAELRRDPGQFDLVVSDLTMPGMNGLELAAQVREIRPDLPLILASGYGGTAELESLTRLGIRELLPKPFPIATLARAVHRHLQPRG